MLMPTPMDPTRLATVMNNLVKGASNDSSAANRMREGFLSCLQCVTNSLVVMKKAVIRGVERLTNMLRSAKSPADATDSTLPKARDITDFSVEEIVGIFEDTQGKMRRDPNYINGMFRESVPSNATSCNEQMVAITNKSASGVVVGVFAKRLCGMIMEGKLFTPDERVFMSENKDNKEAVYGMLKSKFNTENKVENDNLLKMNSLLSCLSTYKEVCDRDTALQNPSTGGRTPEYNLVTLSTCFAPRFFELSADLKEIRKEDYLSPLLALLSALPNQMPNGTLPKQAPIGTLSEQTPLKALSIDQWRFIPPERSADLFKNETRPTEVKRNIPMQTLVLRGRFANFHHQAVDAKTR